LERADNQLHHARTKIMKNILLAACAAIALAVGVSAASADDNRYDNGYYNNGYYDNGYYDNGANSWRYQQQDSTNYGNNSGQRYWNNGHDQYHHAAVSPRSIVQNLERNHYRNISQPLLSGEFYQVHALNPGGHSVKLYIDRYSGQIAKVKG
jgi:opacity protein-like surface antigen